MTVVARILDNLIFRIMITGSTAMITFIFWVALQWYHGDIEYKATTTSNLHRIDSTQQQVLFRQKNQGDSIEALAACICIK